MIHPCARLLWFLALVVSIGLLAAGCRRPPAGAAGTGVVYDPEKDPLVNPPALFEPAPEDRSQIAWDETLYLQLDGNLNTLNPIFFSSGVESTVLGTLFDGPFTFDKEMKWRVNDEFVESYEESEDHTTFTVRLKPGLKWQDGAPLTAHDIVYSWERILDERVPVQAVRTGTDEIKECVALDDLTIRYVQPEPLATSQWNLLFPIIPKHVFEKEQERYPDLRTGEYYNRQNRFPVGSGPYRIVEWRENDRIVVERWEDFHGERPRFRRIVFRIIPDNNVALLSFTKQDVDVIARLSAQQFALETNDTTFQRVGYKAWGVDWGFSYIGWNMDGSNPFFNDMRVRHAMTHALNIPLILERVMYSLSTQCHGIFHPESWMFNPEVELLDYDLEKSAALLDEAGWVVNPRDGWRYKEIDGRQVRFDFTLLIPQGSPTSPKIAAIFQQDLRKLGVNLRTRELEWATFLEKVHGHEFQAQIAAWGTGTDPDTNWNLWRTEEYHTGRNYGGYSNARVDELFAMGRREFDFEARRKIYQEIHKLIYDDQPYIFIANSAILAAFNKRIHGVQLSPRGIYGFNPGLQGWWVRSGEARHAIAMP
jgi:peptide/nickel transport system substrate-binding protein